MADTKLNADYGYGQLELNQCAFRRDGRIEAQCKMADGIDYLENGMILAIKDEDRTVGYPAAESEMFGLNYTAEHMYDERKTGLKNFSLAPSDGFYPRLGYLSIGDTFTTNCLCYDEAGYTDASALESALEGLASTVVFGGIDASGRICLSSTRPTVGPALRAVKYYTMPNGAPGVKFQVIG